MNPNPGSGTPPIPNTDAPRRPAERPTPVEQPQPTPAIPVETVEEAAQDVEDLGRQVQNSGGGADNLNESDAPAE